MENKEELLKRLKENDVEMVREAVEDIKKDGDLSIVSDLLQVLEGAEGHYVKREIITLLADIKDNAFREVLVASIRMSKDPGLKAALLRVCWESALDYSAYALLFAEILIQGSFLEALEAVTVLEELTGLSDEDRGKVVKLLSESPVSEDKLFFVSDVIGVLSD